MLLTGNTYSKTFAPLRRRIAATSAMHATPATPTPATDAAGAANGQKHGPSQGDLVKSVMFPGPPACGLIDIGCNLVDRSFEKDRHEVIERARAANVKSMVVTGTCIRTSNAARKLCEQTTDYPLYFTAGVHPHNAKTCNKETMDTLRQLAAHPRCAAIGEAGLDFNRNFSPQPVQLEWFSQQVALAKELRKPLFLHCRDAGDAFAVVLRRHAPLGVPAVVHCFTGTADELRTFLDLDLHIGITGWVCDDRPERGGAQLAALLPSIPVDRLMIETDAPYLTPRTIKPSRARPGRNEPALLPHVLRAVAQATGRSEEDVARSTTDVARAFFGLKL